MYITVRSLKKTLGKYIEMQDLYIGLPLLFFFLFLFSFTDFKIQALIFLATCIFMLIPISMSKKNRMYKIIYMVGIYLLRPKEHYLSKEESKVNRFSELLKKIKV